MENTLKKKSFQHDVYTSCLKSVRFISLLFIFSFITFASFANSQNAKVNLKINNKSVKEVLVELEKQTDYLFVYSEKEINSDRKVSYTVQNADLEEVLSQLFDNTNIVTKVQGKNILLMKEASSSSVKQQNVTVKGRIIDNLGDPLPGVNIVMKGDKMVGAVSDINGDFSILVPSTNETLVFSYVGFQPQEIALAGRTTVNVTLSDDSRALDELVVVGYGTQKKENLTGAVSSVDVEKTLGSRPIADVGRGLQGTIPGLSVTIPTGEVGSDPVMKIRGQIASIAGSSNPLILLDNVEIPSIQLVNPNDIESISVLKDAAASSIYGSKAAFGVVLITTKKGSKTDKIEVTYSTNLSWQSPFKDVNMAGLDGLEYSLEAHKNRKSTGPAGGFWRISDESFQRAKDWQEKYGGTVGAQDPVIYGRDWYYDGKDKYGVRLYDPASVMIKDHAFSQNHHLSLNGRSNNTQYNIGLGYLGQEGMMKPAVHDDFTRYTGNLSLSSKVTDFLTLRGGVMYSDRTKRYPNSATGFGADPWLYLYRWGRLFPTGVQENGNDLRDPYFDTKKAHDAILRNKYINLNIGTTIDFTKNWDLKVDYTYVSQQDTKTASMPTFTGGSHWYAPVAWNDENGDRIYVDEEGNITDTGGELGWRFPVETYIGKDKTYFEQSTTAREGHTLNAYTTYDLKLKDMHQFKFMLGTNIVSNEWQSHYTKKSELINMENPQFNFAVGTEFADGGANWDSQVGYFSRVNYSFLDKYLLEANIRYDATSKFPSDLRWKWYPSFSAGWVLSNEKFMENLYPVLSFAKIRGSWGTIGDQSVSNSLYIANMDIDKSKWLSSAGDQIFQLGTPNAISAGITWQDIESTNIGVDLRFLKNKLGLTAEWFQRATKNMIIAGDALPNTFGAGAPQGNFGDLRTRGWEVAVDFSHRFSNGIGINVNASISDALTDITKGADWNTPWENRKLGTTYATGKRFGDVYGYVSDRLYQESDFVYDANGNFEQVTIIHEGVAKRTNKLAGPNPVYQVYFEDGNQVLLVAPGDVKFVDVNGDGYINAGKGTFGDPGDQVVIGNSTPRYEYGIRLGSDYKQFDLSVFFQGVGKRDIWGDGQLAIAGYHVKDGAMPQAIAGDFWKTDRTDAFYPRAWDLGGSNSGFTMRPQTKYMLDMSYFKIKNITAGYSVPPRLLSNINLTKARIYVSLENFVTFDKLRGLPIDPEAVSGYSSLTTGNYNLGRTGTGNPAFKSASVGIQITL